MYRTAKSGIVTTLVKCLFDSHSTVYLIDIVVLQLAKAEKLKPLEIELKKLEDLSQSIVNDFAYMRSREEDMRDTNGQLHNTLFCQLVNGS